MSCENIQHELEAQAGQLDGRRRVEREKKRRALSMVGQLASACRANRSS